MHKVSISGGAPQKICDTAGGRGATWGPDDTIIFAMGLGGALMRVPAAGGQPKSLTTLDAAKSERAHLWPELLPGGKAMLFSLVAAGGPSDGRIVVQSVATGERRTLVEGGTHPHYSPTGHVVYGRAGGLSAVPFDLDGLRVTGAPAQVVDGVESSSASGGVHASFSNDGTLAYVPGGTATSAKRTLVWVDRKGVAKPVTETRVAYHDLKLSPDGKRLAVNVTTDRNDIWVLDLARDTLTRLTFDFDNHWHAWTPDGKRLAYGSNRSGNYNLYWKPADGSGPEERLTTSEYQQMATSISPDGRVLAYNQLGDVWVVPLEGDRKPQPFLKNQFQEGGALFSPDGRWVAYESVETGRKEVYVQPYPGPGGKWQISTEGGTEPLWAASGRELFYRSGNKAMVVAVETKPALTASKPKLLFEGAYMASPGSYPYWDVTLDGQRFIMIKIEGEAALTTTVHLVLDWFEDLKRRK